MSWKTGSSLMSDIIEILNDNIDDDEIRLSIYEELIDVFEDRDCDTLDELLDSTNDHMFDEAWRNKHTQIEEEDDDIDN